MSVFIGRPIRRSIRTPIPIRSPSNENCVSFSQIQPAGSNGGATCLEHRSNIGLNPWVSDSLLIEALKKSLAAEIPLTLIIRTE